MLFALQCGSDTATAAAYRLNIFDLAQAGLSTALVSIAFDTKSKASQ